MPAPAASASAAAAVDSGLIVEQVQKGSGWERAGLLPGDVLQAWQREASPTTQQPRADGPLRTPFELAEVVSEQWPRGLVILLGRRGSQPISWPLPRGSNLDWTKHELQVAPILAADFPAAYEAGSQQLAAGNYVAAAERWRSAAKAARERGEEQLAAWFMARLARAFVQGGKWPEADSAYEDALSSLSLPRGAWAAAHLLREWGDTFLLLRKLRALADDCYRRALEMDQQGEPPRVAQAWDLLKLGRSADYHSDAQAAETYYRQALAVVERLAPGSFVEVIALRNLGVALFFHDAIASRFWYQRALEVQQQLDPQAPETAWLLSDLGSASLHQGEPSAAEEILRRALALEETLGLGSPYKSYTLSLLGMNAMNRGDLEIAEDFLRRSLAIHASHAGRNDGPDRPAITLTNLGMIALQRGDLQTAKHRFLQALDLHDKVTPAYKPDVERAYLLADLGIVAQESGLYAEARRYFERSLALHEKVAPRGLGAVEALAELGFLEARTGRFTTALRSLQRALAIVESQACVSLRAAHVLNHMAWVFQQRGELVPAREHYRRSLALLGRLAPGSLDEADALHGLGAVEWRSGHPASATEHLCRAIDALDAQRLRLGGTDEARSLFEAARGDYYRECAEALLQAGQPERAFHVVERGRARSFLSLLAERDLRFADLPPQLAAERRRLDAEYDRTQAALFRPDASRAEEAFERLRNELREIHRRRDEIVARIRRESPRVASLQDPEPFDLARARVALDPGTVLLAYSVGVEKSFLFVVQAPGGEGSGLSVVELPVGREALRGVVAAFGKRIRQHRSDERGLRAEASSLYDLLLRPAEPLFAAGDRLLMAPDGPLHSLPFAALVRNGRYLAEWRPCHTVLSATVYAEIKKARPAAGPTPAAFDVVAFGDPLYPRASAGRPAPVADLRVRAALRGGLSLPSLPGTRREVEGIAAVYPEARIFVGRDATEERAKSAGRQARLLHFACHGLLDEQLPLNSALALSLPEKLVEGQDNGLLQAWEIFEHVRLDADLVTLSACDTALGKEFGGEGFIGLTRAFQYAGARSVLASLWAVPDSATSRLMPRFYRALREGRSKDEALRAAQVAQIRDGRQSHPFYWAAFQLVGDWR